MLDRCPASEQVSKRVDHPFDGVDPHHRGADAIHRFDNHVLAGLKGGGTGSVADLRKGILARGLVQSDPLSQPGFAAAQAGADEANCHHSEGLLQGTLNGGGHEDV